MKKIFIMFLIAVCLLSFVGVSYSNNDIANSGEIWNSLTEIEKVFYIRGFRDGIMECVSDVVFLTSLYFIGSSTPDNEMKMALREMLALNEFIWGHGEAVQTVMDDLYKDPANTYIQWSSMCEIACQKLKGEDIEPLLQKARKEGYLNPLVTYEEYKKKIEK